MVVSQPSIWAYEIINGLLAAQRRGRVTEEQSRELLALVALLPIECEPGFPIESAVGLLETARSAALSAYDAAYVHYCKTLDAALWTLDDKLRAAARDAGVETL